MWIAMLLVLTLASTFTLSFGDPSMHEINEDDRVNDSVQEYCLIAEAFTAKCLKNEVILMNSATYGRMRIGRCLQKESHQLHKYYSKDPLFLGCSVDILHLLDQKCSGRNQCDVPGTDEDMQNEQPCHHGLTLYLEADYKCLTVIEGDRSCHVKISSNPLHMMRTPTNNQSCGTSSQPWILEAPTGQQINVSLLDFGFKEREKWTDHYASNCQPVSYITEKQSSIKRNVSICGAIDQRNTLMYTSVSNIIEIVFNSGDTKDNIGNYRMFLLRFVAVGCSNLIPPEDAWLRRDQQEAVIGCYSSRQTWTLRCIDNHWIGVIGNCTREPAEDIPKEDVQKMHSAEGNYQVLVIVAIVFIGLIICFTVICCGMIMFRRYSSKSLKYQSTSEKSESCRPFHRTTETGQENIQRTLIPSA